MATPEFKYVKYAKEVSCVSHAKLDPDTDRILCAPALNAVLFCGNTVHKYNLRRGIVDQTIKDLSVTVLRCLHVPERRCIFVATVESTIQQYDDSWFQLQRQWLTDDPQICLLAPSPPDFRKGYTPVMPTTLLSGDSKGTLYEWDLGGELQGLVSPSNARVVHSDWVTDLLVPENNVQTLVTASLDCSVKLWERKEMFKGVGPPKRVIKVHDRPVLGILDLPQLDMCLTFGQNRQMYVWSPNAASAMQRLDGHERPVIAVFSGARWEELISVDRGGAVIVWDARFFTKLQQCDDPSIVEDDIVTDACYDVARQCIITTRKHIRDVTINKRGRIEASQAGSSTQAGAVSHVGYCRHTLHWIVVAVNEATIWRARDGRCMLPAALAG
jgi:WD40 repeat protein